MADEGVPDWVVLDGPWCLRNWLRRGHQKYEICFLPPNHEGDCRVLDGGYAHHGNALALGFSKMKEGA